MTDEQIPDSTQEHAISHRSFVGFLAYLRRNWLTLFSAFVLGLAFPLWRMFIYETPEISVEVTEVEKTSDSVRVDVARDPAFKQLLDGRVSQFGLIDSESSSTNRGMDLNQIDRLLDSRKDGIDREEPRLSEQRRVIDELKTGPRFDISVANRLNSPMIPEIEFDSSIFKDNKVQEIEQLKQKFIGRLQGELAEREKALSERKKTYDVARAALLIRQQQANLKLAKIAIKCAISNSGAGAISLRPQAFLRVYLGGNNYVDVELSMKLYDTKGDMQPRSSRIITYESEAIEKFRESDQDKVNTYFKQNVPAALFIVDINGKVYQSNTVPFAQGLYQQSVFDKLRSEASKRKTPDLK